MNKLVLLVTIVFSKLAFAGFPATGIKCTMSYSASGPLNSAKTESTSSWLTPGSTMKGSAMTADGDGAGQSAANYLKVTKVKVGNSQFWNIAIFNSEKTTVGTFSFAEESGMKAIVPVQASANDSEDPDQYDTLEVTCHFTAFAG